MPSAHPRAIGAAVAVFGLALAGSTAAQAEETWAVHSGDVALHFNLPLLRDLGIALEVEGAALVRDGERILEEPTWSFPILPPSDLEFRSEHGIALPPGSSAGAVRLAGTIVLRNRETGVELRLTDLEIAHAPRPEASPQGRNGTTPLHLRSVASGLVAFELVHSMFDFRHKDGRLEIHYLNARLTADAARAVGRPEAAGWWVGMGKLRGEVERVSSTPPAPSAPQLAPGQVDRPASAKSPSFAGTFLDVSLGGLSSIQQVAHAGSFPGGDVALSLETTVCNLGDVDVPWQAPMQEEHPLIHMALYRLLGGRFEQIGVSWIKHGFFAQSNSQCTPCLNPSDGSFLGVGCSDTYTVGNNSNRTYLGPRSEVNPYSGTWECTGSHFADGQPDCIRRHFSNGHGDLDHRLVASDADLDNAGAIYFYEANYIVAGDQNPTNNWGSRRCTMEWTGSVWDFMTPSSGNPLVEGPALGSWGEHSSTVAAAPGDGEVTLAVQTTDLGGGTYHYEYALLNRSSDRRIRSFSLPVEGVAGIANIGFHDNDKDPANDWAATVADGRITWSTETFTQNPNANALVFGYLFNFRFDAEAPPAAAGAELGLFKPGTGPNATAATRGPTNTPTTAVGDPDPKAPGRFTGISPNPFTRSTKISFELAVGGTVKLDIYDAAGRLVRGLVDGTRGAGAHVVEWDGDVASGARAPTGVYFARLRSGAFVTDRALMVRN